MQGWIPEDMELQNPKRYIEAEAKDRLKYSMLFLSFRLAHTLAYFSVIQVFGFSFFPLYWCAGGAAFQAISVALEWQWQYRGRSSGLASGLSPSSIMAVGLVIDATLIAMTRQDVQFTMLDTFSSIDGNLDCIGDLLSVQSCQQQHQRHSFFTTQIFQAVLLYFMLFVLKSSQTLPVGGVCVAVYSAITLNASSKLHLFSFMMHGDLLILVLVYMIGVFARYKMTLSERTLINVLETHSTNVFRQKVRRCRDKMLSTCTADEKTYNMLDIDDLESQAVESDPGMASCDFASEFSISAQSAPAIFQAGRAADVPTCPKEGGDCLPASAVAWLENCPAPRSLDRILPGERVLCYDNVGRGLAYASVVESHPAHNAASADWVTVTLQDGTELRMTADHPVAVQPSPENGVGTKSQLQMGRRCVRAEELNTEQDCLMVLKMVATPVASVAKVPANASAMDGVECDNPWMTITVEQPDRHELFVATRDKLGAPGLPIAVGSSDRLPSALSPTGKLCVKNSFIDGFEEDMPVLKRSNSAPPSLWHNPAGAALSSSQCVSFAGGTEPASNIKGPMECDLLSMYSGRSSISGSTESSGMHNNVNVKVGATKRGSSDLDPVVVRLTDYFHSKLAGVPSMGSQHGPQDGCSPCSFHFTWQRNPNTRAPCKASYMCEYCHDSTHHEKWRSKFRKRRHPTPCMPVTGTLPANTAESTPAVVATQSTLTL